MSFVVTGGSRGIGRAIVLGAARSGLDVVFGYRRDEEAAAETCRLAAAIDPDRICHPIQLDQRSSEACEAFADGARDRLGEIRAVVCNAGILRDAMAFTMKDETWHEVIDTNLTGSFFIARAFLGDLVASGSGRLVFISSIAAEGSSGQANYAASKAGMVGLSRSLAKEYGRKGLTSNVVTPGTFATDMTSASLSERHQSFWMQFCPLRRMGQLDEVAHAVLYLCSREASFVNGATVPVTGGLGWSP